MAKVRAVALRILNPLAIFSLAVLASCAGLAERSGGQLVIIGGGLRPANEAVYRAFLDPLPSESKISVLPTASGVPLESGPGTAGDLAKYTLVTQALGVLEIHSDQFEHAYDPLHVDLLSRTQGFWFTGGVQSRILAVFRPEGQDSPAYTAIRTRLEGGAVVAGTSAGAAMMSDPMIAGGGSRNSLLLGAREGGAGRAVELEQGMGFFPYGMVDQHFLRRGRLGRLVAALEASGQRFGFGVADNCALAVDLGAHRGRAIGERAVLVVDPSQLERDGLSRRGLRISLLGDGDGVDLERGTVEPAAGRLDAAGLALAPPSAEPLEPWGDDVVTQLLERLARDPAGEQRAVGLAFELVLSADERTRFFAANAELTGFCAVGVRLDILATGEAETMAVELERELGSGADAGGTGQ